MNITIKKTTPKEFFLTENLTREVFWNLFKPGCDEHLVLHNLRESKSYVPELDLVAFHDGEVAGHIISTMACVIDDANNESEVLCLGPLSVLPAKQKSGIGGELMKYTIAESQRMGFAGIILFGHPEYYHRFGFQNAKEYRITTKDGRDFEPFMALELQNGSLGRVKGRFFEDGAFVANADELEEFEKQFPFKKKEKTDTQFEDDVK